MEETVSFPLEETKNDDSLIALNIINMFGNTVTIICNWVLFGHVSVLTFSV